MLDISKKTADTSRTLVEAKARHAANVETHNAAVNAYNEGRQAIINHGNEAAIADRTAVDRGNELAELVGLNADESARAPVRAAQADETARAAFHRAEADKLRAKLPELEKHATRTANGAGDMIDMDNAEFEDALAAYVEHLPTLEPLATRLRNAAARAKRVILDDHDHFSALPKIQGGRLFGTLIELPTALVTSGPVTILPR